MILRTAFFTCVLLVAFTPLFSQTAVLLDEDRADSNFHRAAGDEEQFYIIHDINFTGNKRTNAKIVEREIALETGIAYNKKELQHKMRQTREQLMYTSLFVDVLVDTFSLGPNELDVIITLKERWYIWPAPYFKVVDRNWNVWIKEHDASLSRVDMGIKLTHHNVTGNNDKLNLWIIGGYTQRLSFNYFKPYFDKKLRFGYTFGFAYARVREVNYATDSNKQVFYSSDDFIRKSIKAEVGLSYRKGSKLRMQFKPSFNYENVDSAVIKLNPNYFGNGETKAKFVDLVYGLQYYNVDYIPYPLRGWYVDAFMLGRISDNQRMNNFQVGGKFLGTWEIMRKTYLAFQASGMAKLPSTTSYYNSRLLGYGDYYMQGLEYYVADGTAGGNVRTTLRYNLMNLVWHNNLFRSKTHNEIPFRFFLKAYGNLGYVYSKHPGNSFLNNQLLKTAGVGLDICTIYDWVIKLDFSFNQFDKGGKLYLHTQSDF